MRFDNLSIKELCYKFLQEFLDSKNPARFDTDTSKVFAELKSRVDVDVNSFEELLDVLKREHLIGDEEYRELSTAAKIKDISSKALKKLSHK